MIQTFIFSSVIFPQKLPLINRVVRLSLFVVFSKLFLSLKLKMEIADCSEEDCNRIRKKVLILSSVLFTVQGNHTFCT